MNNPGHYIESDFQKVNRAYKLAGIGWWEMDFTNGQTQTSDEVFQIFGIVKDPIQVFSRELFYKLVHPDDLEHVLTSTSKLTSSEFLELEHRIIKPSGEVAYLVHYMQMEFNHSNQLARLHGTTKDITSSKIILLNLKEAERKADAAAKYHKEILENLGSGFFSVNHDDVITDINSKARQLLGATKEQLIGKNLWACFPAAMKYPFFDVHQKVMHGRVAVHFEEFFPPVGPWIEASVYPSQAGICVFFRDIDERRKKAEELRVSNERFEFVSQALDHAIWDLDLATGNCIFNNIYQNLFGYTVREGDIENVLFRNIHQDDRSSVKEHFLASLNDNTVSNWQEEFRYIRSNNSIAYVSAKAFIIRDEPGAAIRVVGSIVDVSHQREAELKLARNEKRFRAMVVSGRDMIVMFNTAMKIEYISPNCHSITGYQVDDLGDDLIKELIHPNDLPKILQEASSLSSHDVVQLSPFRLKLKNGDYRWIETTLTNHLSDPDIASVVANSRDITEKKLAEEELKKLSLVAEETENMVTITDANDNILWVNKAFTRLTEYSLLEVIGKRPADLLSGPDTDSSARNYLHASTINQNSFTCEILNYSKSGIPFWSEVKGQPVFDSNGMIKQFISIITNITERKKSEQQIKLSEEKYRVLFSHDPSPKWTFNASTYQITEVNEAALKLYGYSKDEFLQLLVTDLKLDEDTEAFKNLAALQIENHFLFRKTVRHKKKSGEVFFIEISSHGIILESGTHVIVSGQDMTEKIRLQNLILLEKISAQQEIAKAILSTQERERSEIGKELHDNVNQLITTAKLYVENIGHYPEERNAFIEKSVALLQKSINEIRTLTKTLVPPSFYDIGLEACMFELIDHYRELKMFKVELVFEVNERLIENELKLTMFRIIQEQLNNTAKYAEANHVKISLVPSKNDVEVYYEDDGNGFDQLKKKSGLGLSNIRNRVEVFKGKVHLNTGPGNGYSMKVVFPNAVAMPQVPRQIDLFSQKQLN